MKMYTYKLRPGYGSDKLLLEFVTGTDDENFITQLLNTFSTIDARVENITDLWMNDEVLIDLISSAGKFTLSKDIWGFVFIMADDNQPGISILDQCLLTSGIFTKLEVNFLDYK